MGFDWSIWHFFCSLTTFFALGWNFRFCCYLFRWDFCVKTHCTDFLDFSTDTFFSVLKSVLMQRWQFSCQILSTNSFLPLMAFWLLQPFLQMSGFDGKFGSTLFFVSTASYLHEHAIRLRLPEDLESTDFKVPQSSSSLVCNKVPHAIDDFYHCFINGTSFSSSTMYLHLILAPRNQKSNPN